MRFPRSHNLILLILALLTAFSLQSLLANWQHTTLASASPYSHGPAESEGGSPLRQQGISAPPPATPTAAPTTTPPPACGLFWRYVPSPNPGSYDISYGVAAIATNDVWAVGFYANGSVGHTLAMHWDGSAWSVVSTPGTGFLSRVAGITTSDVWAVSNYSNGSHSQTLTEHWNGSSWSIVPSPNQGSGNNGLAGVVVVAANDVWSVGSYGPLTDTQTLTEHWDGNIWSIVPSPNLGSGNNNLNEVKAVAANDVWAVGSAGPQSLTEHWSGSSWSIVASPNVGSSVNILQAVTVVAANDVWAVGDYANGGPMQTLVEHWNGSVWSVIPSPNGPAGDSVLHGVAAAAANDIWANGYTGATVADWVPFSEHWNGSVWSIVPIPNGPVAHNSTSWGTAAVGVNDIWTVGDDSHTMTQHYSDPCSTVTPTATPTRTSTPTSTPAPPTNTPTDTPLPSATNTPTSTPAPLTNTPTSTPAGVTNTPPAATSTPMPATSTAVPPTQTPGGPTATPLPATNTPMPATSTPMPMTSTPSAATSTPMLATSTPVSATNTPAPATITPTDCPNPFVDIQGNIFYGAIHYLNCHGVINGIDAAHYSPGGTSTRGQFAKVVILGFGTPFYTPSSPDFSDVPASYFAYLYIESGFHAGILSGFDSNSCITHGATFPCYLPNLAITRGQLTKLVVNAAHYPSFTPTGGQPSFTDVLPANVFFVSIETAHYKGVINGYPDRSFRPNQSIRRDEMAQIVYKGVTTP